MTTNKTHYQVLEVAPNAAEDEIKKAYKRLARIYHPDLNPKRPRSAEDRFKRLQQAYDVLSDPNSRHLYDQEHGFSPPRPPQPEYQPQSPPASQPYAPYSKRGKPFPTEYNDDEWTVYFHAEKKKNRWNRIGRRRKLSIVLWAACLLGSFVPATFWVSVSRSSVSWYEAPSLGTRLLWATIPLIMIWIGSWMSEEDGLDTSFGAVGNQTLGYFLEGLGWVSFAYLMWATLLGYVTYSYS